MYEQAAQNDDSCMNQEMPEGHWSGTIAICRGLLVLLVCFATILLRAPARAAALKLVVIGDSLSAEYDALPGIPGVEDPTEYAAVTVPGWEARSWVEVLGALRPANLNLGAYRTQLPGWNDLRFTGYEYNFAIPGFTASQYGEIATSSLFSHPEYVPFRLTLGKALNDGPGGCVVWLGSNEIRAKYSFLCEGGDPAGLIKGLREDLAAVLDFVRMQSGALKLVVVNLPDLGAAPSKQAENPDPAKRQRATEATILANQAIAELATARRLPVADAFAATRRVIESERLWLGPIEIQRTKDANNDPHYAFTREGLHPNTALQIEIARLILETFNRAYGTAIPGISDVEALGLLGIPPDEPYRKWSATRGITGTNPGNDTDGDGIPDLAEFIFDTDPTLPNPLPVRFHRTSEGITAEWTNNPERQRMVQVSCEWSAGLSAWEAVPETQITQLPDGGSSIQFPSANPACFLRLRVGLQPLN